MLIALSFFIFGILTATAFQNITTSTQAIIIDKDFSDISSTATSSSSFSFPKTPTLKYKEVNLPTKNYHKPTGKFTISEVKKIEADRTSAQTGETVNFSVTLKNTGDKKKFLTHICFNHSGGVTFGCVLNKNIFPNDEFNVNNSMIFKNPGNYSVWITWSQDKTNFYRPVEAGQAKVYIE